MLGRETVPGIRMLMRSEDLLACSRHIFYGIFSRYANAPKEVSDLASLSQLLMCRSSVRKNAASDTPPSCKKAPEGYLALRKRYCAL